MISEPDLDLGGGDGGELNELGASFPPLESPPVHFATENNTIVTSQTGSTALVPCVINNIGDGMVSERWQTFGRTVNLIKRSSPMAEICNK